ncbi:MAG: amino acid adenylation domain-containing protein [Ardenticatenaceae bacterium]|nr:amino acid adenylation domain-containing protein [Ardenticatenaceae bacterium]
MDSRLKLLESLPPEKRELVLKKLRRQKKEQAAVIPAVVPVDRDQIHPLSFAQQRLWFLHQLDPENVAYNMPVAIRLSGTLNRQALQDALTEVVQRHEALRTIYPFRDQQAIQKILPQGSLPINLVDLSDRLPETQEATVRDRAREEAQRPFDLAHGPLQRALLMRLNPEEHILLLSMHHIACDGWSIGILIRELSLLYAAFASGNPSPLPVVPIQYVDFVHWQREWLSQERVNAQLSYWKDTLQGAPQMLHLPTDRPRPAMQTFYGSVRRFHFDQSLAIKLEAVNRQTGATPFMSLLATFVALLYTYTGQTDILVGTPVANRHHKALESVIGFFVNTLVLRSRFQPHFTFGDLLACVRQSALDAFSNQDILFERLVEEVQPERNLSTSPLFQVMFVLQNTPVNAFELPGVHLELLETEHTTAKFDLTLFITETEPALSGWFEYNSDLFDEATIERLIAHFERLLRLVTTDIDQPLHSLQLLSPEEITRQLVSWNATDYPRPEANTWLDIFEEHVERSPLAVAVWDKNETLSYEELDRRANRLAHHLQKIGVKPDTLVALCLPRSVNMMVMLLGILKAGGGYLPLDPTYPAERLNYMMRDSRTNLLLTDSRGHRVVERFVGAETRVVVLEEITDILAVESAHRPERHTHADHLAYVIYTSGSTGMPKGAMIAHGSLINYLIWAAAEYNAAAGDSLVHSSIGFDATITSLFAPLMVGRGVHLLPEEEPVAALCAALQGETRYGLIKITPAHLELLAQLLPDQPSAIEPAIVIGGEALMGGTIRFWQKNFPRARLVNEYGPTETVVGCSVFTAPEAAINGPVPIGRPIANTRLYVLDRFLKPVPVGVSGELFIGGAGVGRGYLDRPHLTAEKFLPDPFARGPGQRMYRTGDLVKARPDGTLVYIGRRDNQIKLRGFRIELGEIEAVLVEQNGVNEGVVVLREDRPGDQQLVAYVVPEPSEDVTPKGLYDALQETLPNYMVPAAFVMLDDLPLNENGKVDRAVLPAPEPDALRAQEKYVPPETPIERVLAEIWSAVLGIDEIGVHDNFFHLGGHSLLAVQITTRIREELYVELPIHNLFMRPTIHELAENIQNIRWMLKTLQTVPEYKVEDREEFAL